MHPLDFCEMMAPHQALTNREMQVLCMIASGNSAKEIAGRLFLSDKTVFCYRDRISKKLRLKNTSEIIRYAIRHDLICIE
jgi:DNA-binding CsgD family transcriptional regulator